MHIHKLLSDRLELKEVTASSLKEEKEENQNLDFDSVKSVRNDVYM